MGKKSSPVAPAAPDPVATANAQGVQNRAAAVTQANLNRIDQYTPQGSITYDQIGTHADGTPQYRQTQKLSPEQQALYDQQNQVAQSLGGLALNNVQRVADVQATPFSFDGMQPRQTVSNPGATQRSPAAPTLNANIGPTGQVQTGYNNGGGVQSTFGTGGPLKSDVAAAPFGSQIAGAGDVTRNVNAGPVQTQVNYGGSFDPGEFGDTARRAAEAMYGQAASRLDPQFQQQESDLRARLANSGISEDSEAFRRELDNFGRTRTDAYNQANYSSIGAGLAAQQQGYAQDLSTRQQNVNDITNAGTFANAAQAQQFGQGVTNAGVNNAAQGQIFGQNAAQLDAFNRAQAGNFDQGVTRANLNNAAQGQQYQQNLGAAQFGNQAQQQQNQQNMQQAAFGNAAQDQFFQQALARGGFSNEAIAQMFGMGQSAAGFNNQAQSQDFNQDVASAGFNNQVRQQQIDEAAYLRNLPLNEIAALLGTGGGVQNPQFNPVAQVGVAAPDYMGAVYKNYDAKMQQYNQQQQARSQGLGSIFGLAGTLGAAAISDRRLKHGITAISALANGLRTYVFSYLGHTKRHFGVMADEVQHVRADAIIPLPGGYLAVDYRKVW